MSQRDELSRLLFFKNMKKKKYQNVQNLIYYDRQFVCIVYQIPPSQYLFTFNWIYALKNWDENFAFIIDTMLYLKINLDTI